MPSEYVVIHEEAASYVEVAAALNRHSHMQVEVKSLVVPVHVQLEGLRSKLSHPVFGCPEQLPAVSPALHGWQQIEFVKVEQSLLPFRAE